MSADKFAGHTPGPWHIQYLGSLDECEIRSWAMATNQWQPVALPIARVPHAIYRADPARPEMHIQLAANAELIRSAPELLAENERLNARINSLGDELEMMAYKWGDAEKDNETLRNRVAELEELATDAYLAGSAQL